MLIPEVRSYCRRPYACPVAESGQSYGLIDARAGLRASATLQPEAQRAGFDIALYTRPSARIRLANRENAAPFDWLSHAASGAPFIPGLVAIRSATARG
jgi:hypothetical protein